MSHLLLHGKASEDGPEVRSTLDENQQKLAGRYLAKNHPSHTEISGSSASVTPLLSTRECSACARPASALRAPCTP